MESIKIPNHLGIIMDGNGRWALSKKLSRTDGHKKGLETFKKVTIHAFEKGVKIVSVYAFSTENFKRSKKEVDFLMNLLIKACRKELDFCKKKDIKTVFSGRKEGLAAAVLKEMSIIENETKHNTSGILNICFNYGGHAEIIDATKKIIEDVNSNKLDINKLDEEEFNKYLYNDLPPIDLLIRTSGEYRLSNFMLWQVSYSEFYFPLVHFPDFDEKELDKAFVEYTKRDRRFGGVKDENKTH